jgi:Transposase zinc-ribbon domain
MLPNDLPKDLPTFIARFGTDEQCRDHLFEARWPGGFRCRTCGHDDAYVLARRNIYECAACGQQHSLLTGTIFEQTKTGLAKWFLGIYLVASSKGGRPWSCSGRWALAATRRRGPGCTRSARPRWRRAASRWPSGSRPTRPISARPSRAGRAAAPSARGWSPGRWRAVAARRGGAASAGCGSKPCPTPRPRPRGLPRPEPGEACCGPHRRLVGLCGPRRGRLHPRAREPQPLLG